MAWQTGDDRGFKKLASYLRISTDAHQTEEMHHAPPPHPATIDPAFGLGRAISGDGCAGRWRPALPVQHRPALARPRCHQRWMSRTSRSTSTGKPGNPASAVPRRKPRATASPCCNGVVRKAAAPASTAAAAPSPSSSPRQSNHRYVRPAAEALQGLQVLDQRLALLVGQHRGELVPRVALAVHMRVVDLALLDLRVGKNRQAG